MKTFSIELSKNVYVNHVGLVSIANYLNSKNVKFHIDRASKIKKSSGVITDYDIIKTLIALITLGKTDFNDVEQYRDDKFFKNLLNLKEVPSEGTIRQRFETYDESMWTSIRQINADLLVGHFSDQTIEINGKSFVRLDSDVTPLNNSASKKEGVGRTYKHFDGYAPMISYAGRSGFMINNELRPGKAHSNCPGTVEYFAQTIELAKQVKQHDWIAFCDSGNDDRKLVSLFLEQGVEFIIKLNFRKEPLEKYIDYAKQHGTAVTVREGCMKYFCNWTRDVGDKFVPLSLVVIETTMDKKGQFLLEPEYHVQAFWNSLNLEPEQVLELYHNHGTMEQYHSEFKSDLDLERLPSGKFKANYSIFLAGMLAYNLLRITGNALLQTGLVPGRRGSRLRLRTVMNNIMYMAGQFIAHARKYILKIYCDNPWTPSFVMTT
jgi:hypothetical protein